MSKETNTDEDEEDEDILKLALPTSFERDTLKVLQMH